MNKPRYMKTSFSLGGKFSSEYGALDVPEGYKIMQSAIVIDEQMGYRLIAVLELIEGNKDD